MLPQYCINTYKRSHLLPSRTLKLLSEHSIPLERIHIFVGGDESDLESYKQSCGLGYNYYLVPVGLAASRNFAYETFPVSTPLVFFDDDIKKMIHKDKNAVWNLDEEAINAFKCCRDHNLSLWGIYPAANRLWMKEGYSGGHHFCYGCGPWGILNCEFRNQLTWKEDYERSLYFIERDKSTIRINYLSTVQNFRKESGGLSNSRTTENEQAGCDFLLQKYPTLCTLKKSKSGFPELRIKQKKIAAAC